jgi:hypothetical protein
LLEAIWQEYTESQVHIVYGDTQNASIPSLLDAGYRDQFSPSVTYYVSGNAATVGLGSYYSQYGDGYVPYTVVIGRDRKLYFSMSGYDDDACRAAIDQAIADYDGLVYVANPIASKLYSFNDSEIIDVSNVFDQYEPEIVNVTVLSNTNSAAVTTSMSKANTLTITVLSRKLCLRSF